MIRYELVQKIGRGKTKGIVGCEDTLAEAVAYVEKMNTGEGADLYPIISAKFYDHETRVADIYAGIETVPLKVL